MHFDFKIHAKKGRNAKKKAENAFQFENSCKKGAKMHLQFRNSYTKKSKNGKKESTFISFFLLLCPLRIFLHFKPQNSCKKDKNAKKKSKIIFQKNM